MLVMRHGELFLKGANRPRFEAALLENIRLALRGLPSCTIQRGQGRVFLRGEADDEAAAIERLAWVFGLSSISPARDVPADLDAITAAAVAEAQELVRLEAPRTFAIRARRSDKRFPMTSTDIGREVGAAVQRATGLSVDLTAPDVTVGIEVGPARSFVFARLIPGAGGLPVGVSGRVALLLSGGIDSPVAGYLMQKRGCVLEAVYFHSPPYTGERTRAKVEGLARILARAQRRLRLHVVPFTAVQQAARDQAPRELAVVLYRRSMVRIAGAVAAAGGCGALATGENLGQVASQTLENIACIEDAAPLPVLRPLLAFDKTEIIARARAVGTYDLSIEPYEDCCSLFVPRHPATRAGAGRVRRAERGIEGLDELEARAAAEADVVELVFS